MKNKNLFKKVYQKKINKDKNYEEIISRLNNPKTNKKKYWRLAYVFIIVLSCSLLFISKSNDDNYQLYKDVNTYTTNKVENSSDGIKETYDGKDIIYKNPTVDEIINSLSLPSDFNKEYSTKKINSNEEDIDNYEILFQSNDGKRSITISYSDNFKPLNDFSIYNKKSSIINGINIIIYYKSDIYIAVFTHNKINYLIETKKIDESELNILLKSIIK